MRSRGTEEAMSGSIVFLTIRVSHIGGPVGHVG